MGSVGWWSLLPSRRRRLSLALSLSFPLPWRQPPRSHICQSFPRDQVHTPYPNLPCLLPLLFWLCTIHSIYQFTRLRLILIQPRLPHLSTRPSPASSPNRPSQSTCFCRSRKSTLLPTFPHSDCFHFILLPIAVPPYPHSILSPPRPSKVDRPATKRSAERRGMHVCGRQVC